MYSDLLLTLSGHHGALTSRVNLNTPAKSYLRLEPPLDDKQAQKPARSTGFDYSFKVNAKNVSPAHAVLLSRFADLGCLYSHFSTFVELINTGNSTTVIRSLYYAALAIGVNEVLDAYRQVLLSVEVDMMPVPSGEENHDYPLSKLQYSLRHFFILFPKLDALLSHIFKPKRPVQMEVQSGPQLKRGGEILEVIYEYTLVGDILLRTMAERILFHCHRVLFYQLTAWCVSGKLIDPYAEFFIQPSSAAAMEEALSSTFQDDDEDEWEAGSAHVKVSLVFDMLPHTYISPILAKKILACGEGVRILLESLGKDKVEHNLRLPYPESDVISNSLAIQREQARFDALQFEECIDSWRKVLNRKLWDFIVLRSDLRHHFNTIRDFFLMARGDFYYLLFTEAKQMLSRAPSLRLERDFNSGPVASVLGKCGLDDDVFARQITFRLDLPSFVYPNGKFTKDMIVPAFSRRAGIRLAGQANISEGSVQLNYNGLSASLLTDVASISVPSSSSFGGGNKKGGSLWHCPQQQLNNGFDSRLFVTANASYAVVIQNKSCGLSPRAAGTTTTSSSSVSLSGAASMFEPVSHSFTVEFNAVTQTVSVFVYTSPSATQRRASLQSSNGNTPAQLFKRTARYTCLGTSALDAKHADTDLFNGNRSQEVRIRLAPNLTSLEVFFPPSTVPILTANTQPYAAMFDSSLAWVGLMTPGGQDSVVRLDGWRLTQMLNTSPTLGDHNNTSWDKLRCEYIVKSPLDLILSEESNVMDRYNVIFQVLRQVKRVRLELEKSYLLQNQFFSRDIKAQDACDAHFKYFHVIPLRSRMKFWAENIEYYMQTSITSSYNEMWRAIDKSKDFDEIRYAHERFLLNVSKVCFVKDRLLSSSLSEVFQSCMRYCTLVQKRAGHNVPITKSDIAGIEKDFSRQSSFFFTVIKRKAHRHPVLEELVLKLDYNHYFSKTTEKMGLAQQSG